MSTKESSSKNKTVEDFLAGKNEYTIDLYKHFISEYAGIGTIVLHPLKSMIGISNSRKRIAYVTQFGKSFIHVVFPFEKAYPDNTCFQKIAQVPGDDRQFNHHLRICAKEDVNKEVLKFMKLAYNS